MKIKIKSWNFAFLVSVILLVCSNAYWLIFVIDQAVTDKYQSMTMYHQEQIIEEMGYLIVQGIPNKSKKEVIFMLRQAKPNAFIVDDGDTVMFENVAFHFKNNHLVRVGQ